MRLDCLWYDDHVPQMRLDCLWLLTISCLSFGLSQFLQQSDGCTLDTTAELAARTSPKQLHEVLVAHVEELVKIDASVGIFAEGALLLLILVRHDEKPKLTMSGAGCVVRTMRTA